VRRVNLNLAARPKLIHFDELSQLSAPKENTMSEPEAWMNQKKINGRLCQVDWRLVAALREVAAVLKTSGANVANIERLIQEADKISATVAIPDPPGCDPRDRTAGLTGG
jgi:hypothetical protein